MQVDAERQSSTGESVKREVFEETGVQIKVERLTGVYKNMTRGIVALVFRCSPVAGIPRKTAESTIVEWVAMPDIDPIMSQAYAVRVADGCSVRIHDGFKRSLIYRGFFVKYSSCILPPPVEIIIIFFQEFFNLRVFVWVITFIK